MPYVHRLVPILLASSALLTACSKHDAPATDSTDVATVPVKPAANACSASPTPPITAGGIGPVRVGSSVADVASNCPTHDTTFALEGMTERGKVIRFGPYALTAITTGTGDSSISRVIVTDTGFHTDRGIGVGSRVRDLRDAYGQVCATTGEGKVVVSAAALPGISFATSVSPARLPSRGRTVSRNPSIVPDSARITSLWIFEGRSLCGGS
ncbi:MAG TPA: hypothetical protein VFJ96_08240 [Gemmatimonadaceae bacterium]|jgi:hypothetical protein|nr:hypothetical protein [Gemmatimonadaceae bacterium]